MLTFANVNIKQQNIMNVTFYEQDVKRIFKENNMTYDWWVNPTDGSIIVEVVWGDWKHDHAYLQYIMARNHYRVANRVVTEEDGSDAFSAEYEFKYGY